jgi:hypothetical protein
MNGTCRYRCVETIPTDAAICVLPLARYYRGQRDQHKKASFAGGSHRAANTCKLHNGRNRGHKSRANGDLNFDTDRNGNCGTDCFGNAHGHAGADDCNSSGNPDATASYLGTSGTRGQRGNRRGIRPEAGRNIQHAVERPPQRSTRTW